MAAREEEELLGLINIGSCGLHAVHGAFKTGATATGWMIKQALKTLFVLLHDTPSRREDYTDVTGSLEFPKRFCGTRWVEDGSVAQHAIDIWGNIIKIYQFWQVLCKSKQPSSNSYEKVKLAANYQMTIPKLHFFVFVASHFKKSLTTYQTLWPMIQFHCMSCFVQSWYYLSSRRFSKQLSI